MSAQPTAQQLLLPHRPLILGVAGCSGSGKTLLARELATQLNARLLPLDLYYRDLSHLPFEQRAQQNFDHPDSIEFDLLLHHLDELTLDHFIERPLYDFSTHTRVLDRTTRVDPAPVLIVEGILALHPPALRQRFDLSVFVHTPDAVCLARRIHRDVRERGRTEQAVRDQYAATTRPMAEQFVLPSAAHASVTVEGTEALDWSVATVLHALGRSLATTGTLPSMHKEKAPTPEANSQTFPR